MKIFLYLIMFLLVSNSVKAQNVGLCYCQSIVVETKPKDLQKLLKRYIQTHPTSNFLSGAFYVLLDKDLNVEEIIDGDSTVILFFEDSKQKLIAFKKYILPFLKQIKYRKLILDNFWCFSLEGDFRTTDEIRIKKMKSSELKCSNYIISISLFNNSTLPWYPQNQRDIEELIKEIPDSLYNDKKN